MNSMNGFTLTAIIVVTIGAVAIVWAMCLRKAAADAIFQGGQAAEQTVDAATEVANKVVDAARSTAEPLAQGAADICHSIARRIEVKSNELKELRERVTALSRENEQLQNRRINVDQIEPILKIAFLQTEFSETNFVRETARITPGSGTARNEEIEYLGVYRAINTQRFGVDLNRVKFRLVAPATIEVAGLDTAEVIGNLNTEITPVHTELRRHLTGGVLSDVLEIVDEDIDQLLLTHDRQQRENLHKAITPKKAVQQIDRALEEMALQFLKDHFTPRGYILVKAAGGLPDGKSLFQISAELNAKLDGERVAKTRLLTAAVEERDAVDRQLALDIGELKTVGIAKTKTASQ